MNINEETLEAAGYRKYKTDKGEFCLGLWQKTIRAVNTGEKLYYINFYLWQFPSPADKRASVEVALFRKGGLTTKGGETDFRVAPQLGPHTTIEEVERFFIMLYLTLECIPDVHNN